MKTLTHNLYYADYAQRFTLYSLTDLHLGARACNERQLKADIDQIATDPNALWIGGGDYIDAICQAGDKRFDPRTLSNWVLKGYANGDTDVMGMQARYAVNLLAPIVDKCLGLVKGNHCWAAETWYARDLYWEIVLGLAMHKGVAPEQLALGAEGFVVINFRHGTKEHRKRSWRFTTYIHHGYGGGRLPGSHALALGRVLGDYECDLALMGHRHVQAYVSKVIRTPYDFKTRIGMFVPSYLESHIIPSNDARPVDTYSSKFGLPAQIIGTVPVSLQPATGRIGVLMSNQPGLSWAVEEPVKAAEVRIAA